MQSAVGQLIGNYRLVRRLGAGGFAEVYLGEHKYLGSQTTIKILKMALGEEALNNFLAEARILHQMTHPHIIRILDFGIEHEMPFLVMDYAQKGTLRTLYPAGTQIPLPGVVEYVTQVAKGLQHIHDQHIIHRDLKPENLLLGSEGQILISDFGLAITISQSSNYVNMASLAGSIAYMSPEHFNQQASYASDQYALSVMVYEWLCGKLPFKGTPAQLCYQHLNVPPQPLRELLPDLPAPIEHVIATGLAKEPQQRFADVRTFARALTLASQEQPPEELLSLFPTHATPPVIISSPTPRHSYPLPISLTRLIGREQERQAVNALLLHPDMHLVTLTGPGGIGKTQLALACAYELRETFQHGVCFVSLVSVHEPAQVLPAIAQALGLKENSGHAIQEILQSFLREKRLLLVLDNLEQVVDAASDLIALLSFCPGVTMLITSRAALQAPGERQFPVPPLDLPLPILKPDVEELASNPAVALFIERAQAIKPDFQLTQTNASAIVEICTRLDGLPLALELAAARTRLLPPQTLLAHLPHSLDILTGGGKSRPARQQTLRATIQWSYDLLSPAEQQLFRRLSIFSGGCSFSAVEGLYTALGEETASLLDLMDSLLNKSLLEGRPARANGPRLLLLQTLREFGLEQLAIAGEVERCEIAHAAYFQLYVKQAILSRLLPFYDAPIEVLTTEYANIRATLVTLIRHQDLNAALRLASSLTAYWTLCNLFSEGRNFLEQLLRACPMDQDDEKLRRILPTAYNSAGWLAYWQNDLEYARELVQVSLNLFQARKSTQWRGSILRLSALIEMTHPEGNFAKGEALYRDGVNIHRELGERGIVGFSLLGLVTQRIQLGELVENRALSQESLALCQEFDLPWAVAGNLHHLGWLSYLENDYIAAIKYTEEALHLLKKVEAYLYLDEALMIYAFEQFALGDEAAARATLTELWALAQRNGDDSFTFHSYYGLGRLALLQGNLSQAASYFEKAIATIGKNWRENRTAWWLPGCLEGMAMVALQQDQPAWATRLLSAAHTRRSSKGCYFALGQEKPAYDQALHAIHAALGDAAFTIAWEEGCHLLPTRVLTAREPVPMPTPLPLQPHRKGQESLSPTALALGLTPREVDTLRLLALGLTNHQIAEQLVLSTVTVNAYLRSVYSKLGVTTRAAATRYALDHQLL